MKAPQPIELDLKQVEQLLKRVEARLSPEDYQIIKSMADTIQLLSQSIDQKAVSIRRLLRMLFGAATEKLEKVDPKDKKPPKNKPKPKGHGRKKADDYTGATKVRVPLSDLKNGDTCPECIKGKIYPQKEPKKIVRITGNAPLSATVYLLDRLRCNLCGEIFTAKTPEGVGEQKYDAAAKAMIAILKYGSGMPFYRLQKLQQSIGIPLSASTQFEYVDQVATAFDPVYQEWKRQSADGELFHNDDTTMKILAPVQRKDPKRKGIFTTGILSIFENHRIALFFTGPQHAGENLDDLLKLRGDPKAPLQMCDALSRNLPKTLKVLLANCLAHGRRRFVEILSDFPDQCRPVLETLATVYKNDQTVKDRKMSGDERLRFHQNESGPMMNDLKIWLDRQLNKKLVEPNSSLGQSISYMLNHWEPLTLFLREPNAPLDNNICERALKMAILNRKNALFYKTLHGAEVGDKLMSLIHTCNLASVNPFTYLTALLDNADKLKVHPARWMPWNYTENLTFNPYMPSN